MFTFIDTTRYMNARVLNTNNPLYHIKKKKRCIIFKHVSRTRHRKLLFLDKWFVTQISEFIFPTDKRKPNIYKNVGYFL